MTNYNFETIDATRALAISAADTLTFVNGSASRVTVLYSALDLPTPARIDVIAGGHTVAFGTGLSELTQAGGAIFADGSRLFVGGAGDDRAVGTDAGDGLYGGAGADTLDGGRGDDFLQGNSGDDSILGGLGSNTIHGGKGDDSIIASTQDETRGSYAHGNQGDDVIVGGSGADTLLGGQGDDFIAAGAGNDHVSGDLGRDELHGGAGDDTLLGGAGNDILQSGGGHDLLLGGDGDDMIVVERSGGATVYGEAGNDVIVSAAAGKDILSGGEGRDVFEFATTSPPAEGQDDVIIDWEAGDKLSFPHVGIYTILPQSYSEFVAGGYAEALAIANQHISGAGVIYAVAQVGADVVVFADSDGNPADGADIAVVLAGRTLADINLSDFI